MALEPGSRLGPYEILAAIGAGGMGEVYRRLRLLGDLPYGHRAAARPDADSTAALVSSLRSGSRGANLLPRFARETIRAANRWNSAARCHPEERSERATRDPVKIRSAKVSPEPAGTRQGRSRCP